MSVNPQNDEVMKWEYGQLRAGHAWVIWVTLGTGVLSLPLAWFLRDSLTLGRAPLPPWTVLLVGGVLAATGLVVSISMLRARSRPAKLITIKQGEITVPGSLVSGPGWSLPITDVNVRKTDLGFVKQMHLSAKRKRTTLSSAMFRSDDDFDRLFEALSNVSR